MVIELHKVVIELHKMVIELPAATRSCDFVTMRLISDKTALHSVHIPLLIVKEKNIRLCIWHLKANYYIKNRYA